MAVPLGPLDRVIASPGFHRAHHAVEGRLGNFGGVLSVWDHLLGTARAPDLDVPTGLPSTAGLPETLLEFEGHAYTTAVRGPRVPTGEASVWVHRLRRLHTR